jgi:hypothetical protein
LRWQYVDLQKFEWSSCTCNDDWRGIASECCSTLGTIFESHRCLERVHDIGIGSQALTLNVVFLHQTDIIFSSAVLKLHVVLSLCELSDVNHKENSTDRPESATCQDHTTLTD